MEVTLWPLISLAGLDLRDAVLTEQLHYQQQKVRPAPELLGRTLGGNGGLGRGSEGGVGERAHGWR